MWILLHWLFVRIENRASLVFLCLIQIPIKQSDHIVYYYSLLTSITNRRSPFRQTFWAHKLDHFLAHSRVILRRSWITFSRLDCAFKGRWLTPLWSTSIVLITEGGLWGCTITEGALCIQPGHLCISSNRGWCTLIALATIGLLEILASLEDEEIGFNLFESKASHLRGHKPLDNIGFWSESSLRDLHPNIVRFEQLKKWKQ